jgi:hypothetical protein
MTTEGVIAMACAVTAQRSRWGFLLPEIAS